MRRYLLCLAVLGVAACEGGGDPVDQAVREISANYHAKAVKDGTISGPVTAETPIETSAADQALIDGMIADHQAAIAKAREVVNTTSDPQLKAMAERTITARSRELAELQAR